MKSKLRHILILLFFAFTSLTRPFFTTHTYADDNEDTGSDKDAILQISPGSQRLSLKPQDIIEQTIRVKNLAEGESNVLIYSTPFFYTDKDSGPNFGTNNRFTQLTNWITFLSDNGTDRKNLSITLSPQEARDITYRISVPDHAPGGGQYAGIFVETADDESQGIKTSTRVGTILYANIDGDTITGSNITNTKVSNFSTTGIITVSADIENTGNIDFQSSISIKASTVFDNDLFSDTTVSTILPETTKKVSISWDSHSLGLFKIDYQINALDTSVSDTCIVFIIPISVIVLGLLLLTLTIIAIVYHIKKSQSWRL